MKSAKEALEDIIKDLKTQNVELREAIKKKANEVNTLNMHIEQHKGAVTYNEMLEKDTLKKIAALDIPPVT